MQQPPRMAAMAGLLRRSQFLLGLFPWRTLNHDAAAHWSGSDESWKNVIKLLRFLEPPPTRRVIVQVVVLNVAVSGASYAPWHWLSRPLLLRLLGWGGATGWLPAFQLLYVLGWGGSQWLMMLVWNEHMLKKLAGMLGGEEAQSSFDPARLISDGAEAVQEPLLLLSSYALAALYPSLEVPVAWLAGPGSPGRARRRRWRRGRRGWCWRGAPTPGSTRCSASTTAGTAAAWR